MTAALGLIGLNLCRCGAPFCRECGDHCERVENIGLPGWEVGGWRCGGCGWCITDVWTDDEGPSTLLH